MNRLVLQHTLLLLLSTAALAPRGEANEFLYLGGGPGLLQRGSPAGGNFEFLPGAVGAVQALVADGEILLTSDPLGRITRYDDSTQTIVGTYDVQSDGKALTVGSVYLYVGGTDGAMLIVDKWSGAMVGSWDAGAAITAMHQIGDRIYVGRADGEILSFDLHDWYFMPYSDVNGPISSMTADESHLIVGAPDGQVHRVSFETQLVDWTYRVKSDATALVASDGALYVGSGEGRILRVHAETGWVMSSFDTSYPITALDLGPGADPGTAFCFGSTDCPCQNPSFSDGCLNSTSAGASLRGSGSASTGLDDLTLTASNLPPNQWGLVFMGGGEGRQSFGDGLLCARAGDVGIYRFGVRATGAGSFEEGPGIVGYGLRNFPTDGQIVAGESWYFQGWYRDSSGPCGSGFNTTNAFAVTFAP